VEDTSEPLHLADPGEKEKEMGKKHPLFRVLLFFMWILTSALLAKPASLFAQQVYTLEAPNYSSQKTADGFDQISIEGYLSYGVPGYPDLPCRLLRYAVPPDVDERSIEVEYDAETIDLGIFQIKELPLMATRDGQQEVLAPSASIYANKGYYPKKVIEYLGYSQMRKWRFVNLKYTPFQYNPVTGELRYVPKVQITITYDKKDSASPPIVDNADEVGNKRARDLLLNYAESEEWYKGKDAIPMPGPSVTYVIITTNAIESASTKLGDFVTYLENSGYFPYVITETEYGSLTGQPPNGTAEKIRKWLQDNYTSLGIVYVLLIGDPDPDDPSLPSDAVGDVPMKMCWPRKNETVYREAPTDYFYADLTGNWDLDNDQYFGEYEAYPNGDRGTGGVDFANEVYVGRIPVYDSAPSDLDSVLAKTIDYGTAEDIGWRRNALLPMSFSDASTDGAYLSQAMIANYLTRHSFSNYRLYMQGSECSAADSTFSSHEELLGGATKTRWMNHDYGMVWWWGHGNSTGAYIGYGACESGRIMSSSDAPALNDSRPSFVYQCSCSNGYPENSNNLGTALLYNGAITTTSATRVSWYAVTSWRTGLKYFCDNASIGYFYGNELVSNHKKAAVALYDVKSDMGAHYNGSWEGVHWMNLFDFNLYGDPAMPLRLQDINLDLAVDFGSSGLYSCDDGVWSKLSGGDPQNMVWWSAGLAVDFGSGGLWNFDGSPWSQLSGGNPQNMASWSGGLAVDFGSGGLWNFSAGKWSKLSGRDPQNMASWSGGLAVDFGSGGLWNFNGSPWSQLSGGNPQNMASWSGGLAVDFGGGGLWSFNGSAWSKLSGGDSQNMVWWSGSLAVDFGSGGLWSFDGSGWAELSGGNPQNMVSWSGGLAVDFGGGGLWSFDGSAWSTLSGGDPQNVESWGSGDLAVDFGTAGLWYFDGLSWGNINAWNPQDMVVR